MATLPKEMSTQHDHHTLSQVAASVRSVTPCGRLHTREVPSLADVRAIVWLAVNSPPLSTLQRLRVEHGLKALRYCGVSVVNVTVGVSVLVVCHALFGWTAVQSNLAAWAVGTTPAYLLSRAWVWQQSGRHRIGSEVITFWLMAFVGLVLSSLVVRLVEHLAENTLAVVAGNLSAYGLVWIAKYLYLDNVMWSSN